MRPSTYEGAKIISKAMLREFRRTGHSVRMSDAFEATARGMGFRHWHDVVSGFRPDRVAPWSDRLAAAVLRERCGVDAEASAAALRAIGDRFASWN